MSAIPRHRRAVPFAVAAVVLFASAAPATEPRYTVIESGGQRAVQDDATGLIWQQQSSSGPINWKDALAHCENLEWAGWDDWRLPDIVELSTIVDERRTAPPTINTVFFAGFEPGSGYWSSTTAPHAPGSAYVLYFNDQNPTVGRGGTSMVIKTSTMRALCVRNRS